MNLSRHKRGRRTRWPVAAVGGVAALVLAGVGFAAAATVGAGSGDSAAGVKAGTYNFAVAKSGLCMDLVGGSASSGGLVQQWGCSQGQSNQQWTLVDRGSGKFNITSAASRMCLDVPGASTASGTRLQQWGCGTDHANQLWTLKAARDDTFQIVNVNSGLCVSDAKASTASGAAVIQETCTTNSNKRWKLTPVTGGSAPTATASATAAASGTTITVAADGSGDVKTVQAAIDKVPVNNTKPVTVAIKKGIYRGVVTIPSTKPYVTLKGLGSAASDVVIVENHGASVKKPDGTTYGTFGSATVRVDGHDFSASNLTMSNDYDNTVTTSQALALSLSGDRAVLTNVRLLGHQDTLLVNEAARAYVRKSYVEGTVDFIYGGGIAVFDQSEIHQLGNGGVITAASTPATRAYGFLFYRSNITGDSTGRKSNLGRPWRQDAQVLYRESTIGSSVDTGRPWTDMSTSLWRKARFSEYKNTGPGATVNSDRPQLSDSKAAAYTPAKYLAGSDGWNPMTTTTTSPATGTVCKPTSYGAKGDGRTKDTAALQKAINACAGKGTVELTSGRYLSGALTLAGDLTFTIDSGATLLASQNPEDYPLSGAKRSPLLGASGVRNLTISGAGTIDGQGAPWWAKTWAAIKAGQTQPSRPGLILASDTSNVKITGITLKNAPNVHITLNKVTTAAVDRITISAPSDAPNTDGIDVWSSSGVAVTNSTIDNGDDDIAIASSSAGASHDISLSNCVILHGHGLSIGSFTGGGIYDINIHDNTLTGTSAGVRIKTARGRGGNVHDVTYRNLTMTDVRTPILITGYYPRVPADGDAAQAITSTTPHYHDITIANVTATGADTAGQIIGVPEQPITGLTLSSVSISAKTGLTVRNATVTTTSTTVKPASGSAFIVQSKATVK
ncbi:pectinesterase family protein [Streptomyces canus]|uniref:pectinesterase family protein n=1 Tax=Streptomyces canus TaxID=58343 RepID=UPI00277F2083|nr:pectinesterase family protein [Streptomyces canus]MDQ1068732.1 pectin methylesterase-like acyl-CoA thioesterase [Streptomyces canus]